MLELFLGALVCSVSTLDVVLFFAWRLQHRAQAQRVRYLDHLQLLQSETHRVQLALQAHHTQLLRQMQDTSPRMRAIRRQRREAVIARAEMRLGSCLLSR